MENSYGLQCTSATYAGFESQLAAGACCYRGAIAGAVVERVSQGGRPVFASDGLSGGFGLSPRMLHDGIENLISRGFPALCFPIWHSRFVMARNSAAALGGATRH